MRYRVLPYKMGSRSASSLAQALGGKVLRLEGSTYKPRTGDVVINWGNSSYEGDLTLLNDPTCVQIASNKAYFFERMAEECPDVVPQHWVNKDDIPADAYPVVCRTILSGHSGAGIVIARVPEEVVDCQLYVKYEKKKDEYRVHCGKREWVFDPDPGTGPEFKTVVISLQRKARRLDCEDPDWQVRNHSNGFVYVRDQVNPPASVIDMAKAAFSASGLDFGAVDVIWNEHHGRAYVLEINTAPGLEGQTVQDYANFFQGISNV